MLHGEEDYGGVNRDMLQMPSRRPQVVPIQESEEGDQGEEEDDKPLQKDLQHLHQAQLQEQD